VGLYGLFEDEIILLQTVIRQTGVTPLQLSHQP